MNAYLALFKVNLLERLQYKWDLFLGGFGTVVYTFALFHLWKAIYSQSTIGTFTLLALSWYTLIGQVLRSAGGRPVNDISEQIQNGTIVSFLNKPVQFLYLQASTQYGKRLFQALSGFLLGGVMLSFLIGFIPLQLIHLLPLLLIFFLGTYINFILGFSLATFAFWIEDARPIHWIYDKVIFIFGGFLFPLDILPAGLQAISSKLPMADFVYYPAKLAVQFSWPLFWQIIGGQAIYILVLTLLAHYLLRRGTKNLSVNGG